MRLSHVLAAAAVLVGSVSFAQTQKGTMTGMPAPKDLKEIADSVHHINQTEIRLGQLAQQRGHSAQVKDFAKMMVTDHQQLEQQLATAAKQKGWKLEEPKANDPTHAALKAHEKATEAALKQLSGPAFDSLYMAEMVWGHDEATMMISAGTQQFQGDKFTQVLTQALPKIQQQRDQAYRTLGQIKPSPEQMGVGGAGTAGQMEQQPGAQQKQQKGMKEQGTKP